jgi:hypothetical protein
MRHVLLALIALFTASPALAQSPYVVGSFGMDVSRLAHVESGGFSGPERHGEVMSGALRAGTSVGDRWGVELEFARGATLESEVSFGPRPLTFSSGSATPLPIGVIGLNLRQRMEQRHQTVATLASFKQVLTGRFDLVYLGGVGFWRTTREQQVSFTPPSLPGIPIILPPQSQTTRMTSYGVDPVVGVEAHVGLTDHVRLVPGMRLQGIGDVEGTGWQLRAGVGLGWFF